MGMAGHLLNGERTVSDSTFHGEGGRIRTPGLPHRVVIRGADNHQPTKVRDGDAVGFDTVAEDIVFVGGFGFGVDGSAAIDAKFTREKRDFTGKCYRQCKILLFICYLFLEYSSHSSTLEELPMKKYMRTEITLYGQEVKCEVLVRCGCPVTFFIITGSTQIDARIQFFGRFECDTVDVVGDVGVSMEYDVSNPPG